MSYEYPFNDADEEIVLEVFNKGKEIPGLNASEWRFDACGTKIRLQDHGDTSSEYGWEIDHINPRGGDEIGNLQSLQWENNAAKSDGVLKCVVTANGTRNSKS